MVGGAIAKILEQTMQYTRKQLAYIADIVALSALENARETVRENHPAKEGRGNYHPEFPFYFVGSVDAIAEELGGRGCEAYGCHGPLSRRQIERVKKLAKGPMYKGF